MVSSLIFQKFSGEGLTEPLPRPLPPLFSRALPSVRASPSILGRFVPSTRASPSIRASPLINLRLGTLVWPPNNFLDPPLMPNVPNALVAEAPLHTPQGSLRCFPNPLIVGVEKQLRSGDASMTQGGGVPP